MEDFKWLVRQYRYAAHISSDSKLSAKTGIPFGTLNDKYKDNGCSLTMFQLRSLDEVLNFSDNDLLKIVRGNFTDNN